MKEPGLFFECPLIRFSLVVCVILSLSSCLPGKRSMYLNEANAKGSVVLNWSEARPVVQAGDVLSIEISCQAGLSQEAMGTPTDPISVRSIQHPYLYGYTVNDSGYVSLPTIGSVNVAGKTAIEIQASLQETAAQFFPNPTVKVNLMNFLVSVLGEVNRPGRFPVYTDRISIFQAISESGDLAPYADREEVQIIRERNGKKHVMKVDLTDPAFLQSDFYYLQPGDVVFVTHLRRKRFVGRELQLGIQGLGVAASILGVVLLLERTK